MAVPDIDLLGQSLEERRGTIRRKHPLAVLPMRGAGHGTPKITGEKLHAIADAEDRQTEIVDRWIDLGSLGCVNARRATREDDSLHSPVGDDLAGIGRVGQNLRENPAFTHAPGDHLRVL